uniref:Uncharacterized protein n=1 Tax=Magallana gigas TaxID=29159 RepID=K1PIC6_MAGGI
MEGEKENIGKPDPSKRPRPITPKIFKKCKSATFTLDGTSYTIAEAFVIVEVSYSVLSPSQMPYVITAVIFPDANWSVGDGRRLPSPDLTVSNLRLEADVLLNQAVNFPHEMLSIT